MNELIAIGGIVILVVLSVIFNSIADYRIRQLKIELANLKKAKAEWEQAAKTTK